MFITHHPIMRSNSATYLILFLTFGLAITTGCEDDPVDPPAGTGNEMPLDSMPIDSLPMDSIPMDSTSVDSVEASLSNGFFIQGSAVVCEEIAMNLIASVCRIENLNAYYNSGEIPEDYRPSLMETYLLLQAGDFSISQMIGGEQFDWGFSSFPDILTPAADQPDGLILRGSLSFEEDALPISVNADGFYHFVIDTETGAFLLSEVTSWGVIGAATASGWGSSTELTDSEMNCNGVTFSGTDIPLTVGDCKMRYGNGWKILLDPDFVGGNPPGVGFSGLKINTNLGHSIDELRPGGNNLTIDESGFYTITLNWSPEGGYSSTFEKTADLASFDYSNTELGLIGDGLIVGGSQHNWGVVTFSDLGAFKIREGQSWDGINYGFSDVTIAGMGGVNFVATPQDDLFMHSIAGNVSYSDVTFTINAATDERIFSFGY